MATKFCGGCNSDLELDKFHIGAYWCKVCVSNAAKNRKQTVDGLIKYIYRNQILSSKKRQLPLPSYSLEWFRSWLSIQKDFFQFYENWREAGFTKDLIPSVDRLDDSISYTKDNIRLTVWKENRQKRNDQVKSGEILADNKAVVQYSKDNVPLNVFHSRMEAQRRTGVNNGHISKVCLGQRKSAGGYVWKNINH